MKAYKKITTEAVLIIMGLSIIAGVCYWFGELFNQIIK